MSCTSSFAELEHYLLTLSYYPIHILCFVALARIFYEHGAKVILSSRDVSKLNNVRDACIAMENPTNIERVDPVVLQVDLTKIDTLQGISCCKPKMKFILGAVKGAKKTHSCYIHFCSQS